MNNLAQGPIGAPADTVVPAGHDAFRPLLELAVPTVYRTNAFRMVGLRVDASSRDIARRTDMLRMVEKLGTSPPVEASPMALNPPPGNDIVREALQRVRDPERRLAEELFWFWPLDATRADDKALAALAAGDTTTAVHLWRERGGGVGTHNLAVMFHAAALDLEISETPLTRDEERRRDRCWQEGLACWKATLDADEFWDRVGSRIQELADPRLHANAGAQVRASLARTILSISAGLAVGALEHQASEVSARHMAVIAASGFDAEPIELALRSSLTSLRQRIVTLCQSAESESSAAPERAADIATRLLDLTAPLLAPFSLLRKGDTTRASVHDEVALRALACQIVYGNKTEDWKGSLDLLKRILPLAASESARQRIEANRSVVQKNVEFDDEVGLCWFCRTRKPDAGAAIEVKMHGNVMRVPTGMGVRVTWSTMTVQVPRCESCKTVGSRGDNRATLAFIAIAVLGFGSCGGVGVDHGGALVGIAGLVLGGIVASRVKKLTLAGVKPLGETNSFPGIVRRKEEGWAFGEKPQGVQ